MPRLLELFSGTGSVGKEFDGEVVSVDIAGDEPTHRADILEWDYTFYDPHHFDMVWASPPCTQYSKARTWARTPRDLEGADALVRKALDIIDYFRPRFWFVENPWGGLLRGREVVAHLPPPKQTSYCMYGYPYQKHTAIWTNAAELELPVCNKDCAQMVLGPKGRWKHPSLAQRFNRVHEGPRYAQAYLYSMPPGLCRQICDHVLERLERPAESGPNNLLQE